MTLYYCVRVYANGSAKHTMRDDAGLESWLSYNRAFRFGNALFVNGELPSDRDRGYLNELSCNAVSQQIKKELASGNIKVTLDRFDKDIKRYPDERERKGFAVSINAVTSNRSRKKVDVSE